MQAGTYNIYCDQGSTFSLTLTLTDGNDDTYDLTNYTARMQVRRGVDSATAFVDLTTENGGITIDGPAGTITLDMDDATTAAIPNSGVYDLEIVSAQGVVSKAMRGDFVLQKEVTR